MTTVCIYTFMSIILCISTMLKSMHQHSFVSPIHIYQTNTRSLVSNDSIYAAQLKALSHVVDFGTPQSQNMLAKLRMRTTLPLSLLKYRAARQREHNNQSTAKQLTLLLQQSNQRVQLNKRDSQLLLEQSQLLKDMSGDLGDSGDQEIAVDMLSNKHQVVLFLDCLALMPATKESDIAQELLNYLQAQSIPDLGALLTAAEFFSIDNMVDTNASFCSVVSKALAYKLIDTQECTAHQELVFSLPVEIQRRLVQHILDSTGLRSALHIKYNSRHPITVIPLENSKDNIGDLDSESLSTSPNKRYITGWYYDSWNEKATGMVWNSETGQCVHKLLSLQNKKNYSMSIMWSPNSKYFVIPLANEKSIKILDSETGQCLYELSTDKPWSLKWSPDSKYLAYIVDNITIKIWDSETGEWVHELLSKQKVNQIYCFLNSKYIVCRCGSSSNETISIWDSESGQCLYEYDSESGHCLYEYELTTAAKNDTNVVWCSPNSRYLAFTSNNQTVKIWDSIYNEFSELPNYDNNFIKDIEWSPNSEYLISEHNNKIYMWDITSKQIIKELSIKDFNHYRIRWSSNSKYVALMSTSDYVRKIRIWSSENYDCYAITMRQERPAIYNCIRWSPDSTYLLAVTEDYEGKQRVRIWDSENGNCFEIPQKYKIWGVHWSPNDRYLITTFKSTIKVWDVKYNNCLITYQAKNQNLKWCLDGSNTCIFGTNNNYLLIWQWITKDFDRELASKLTLKSVLLALHSNKDKKDTKYVVKSLWPMLNSNTSKLDILKQSKSAQAALTSVGIYTGFKVLKYALQKAHDKG